jgi:phosphoglucosamine mutase
MTRLPQVMRSFAVGRRAAIESLPGLGRTIRGVENELRDRGRVLVRFSGTEAKLRVMVECEDETRADQYVARISEAAIAELGTPA